MINRRALVAGSLAAGAAAAFPRQAAAVAGVFPDKIVFGQAAVLEGPASALGIGMRDGLTASFAELNAAGGIKGRKLELISRNDDYEPTKCIEVTKALLDEGVFALIGPVGTPTAMAAHPLAAQAGVPFIGPFTGAEGLRHPYQPHIVNIRASYFQETEVMVERLTKDRGFTKIAILFQDDAFGRAGLAGTEQAMQKRSLQLVASGSYERNTVAVRNALLEIRKAGPEAVVMIGAYKPCAEFIKLCRQLKFDPTFFNISFVGSQALAQELGAAGTGVLVTQVVPFPGDASIPVVAAYQKALHAFVPAAKPGFVSLEGYLVGRTVIAAMEKLSGEPTHPGLMEKLMNGSYDLGGFPLNFAPGKNQGSDAVYLTVIGSDGELKPIHTLA